MRVCIHRGTQEVGGTCIEIESAGKRIVLDVGLPLEAEDSEVSLPHVKGFREQDPSLLAVVISHPHQDHYGLAKYLLPDTPMMMGDAAERILRAACVFTLAGVAFQQVRHLEHRASLSVGPFTLTPFLNDHSGYDAYSLLIEADGRRVFYSGDLRGHGRKAKIFQQFLKNPPTDINVLLMEGTTIGRVGGAKRFPTERELESCFLEQMRRATGLVLVWASAQNIDRLVTMFKACKKSGRQLVIDMYTAEILRVTGNPKLPQATWEGIKVFLPQSQKRQIIKGKLFTLAKRYKAARIYPEQLAEQASRSAMLFRPSMRRDLEKAACLKGAHMIYSLWHGYLERKEQRLFREWLDSQHIPLTECHTSGHASISDLQALARSLNPKMLVPIHSFETGRFKEFFDRVEQKEDGKWWEVG